MIVLEMSCLTFRWIVIRFGYCFIGLFDWWVFHWIIRFLVCLPLDDLLNFPVGYYIVG